MGVRIRRGRACILALLARAWTARRAEAGREGSPWRSWRGTLARDPSPQPLVRSSRPKPSRGEGVVGYGGWATSQRSGRRGAAGRSGVRTQARTRHGPARRPGWRWRWVRRGAGRRVVPRTARACFPGRRWLKRDIAPAFRWPVRSRPWRGRRRRTPSWTAHRWPAQGGAGAGRPGGGPPDCGLHEYCPRRADLVTWGAACRDKGKYAANARVNMLLTPGAG